jgi:MoaA/NifB/PqqE/SkfB family radical SAM enzyme
MINNHRHLSLDGPPSSIAIELTTRCNLSCKMCSVWKRREPDLPLAKVLALLEEARALGAERFDPYGTELFTRPDMPEILAHADRIGFREIYVVSNGVLLNNPKLLNKLAGLKSLVIVVSIDGPRDIHDALRGDGVFDQAVSALRELGRRGIRTSIATIIMRPTLEHLPKMVDLAADLSIPVISMQPYCREVAGPGCDHGKFEFRPEEKNRVETELKALLKYAERKHVTIYTGNLLKHVASYLAERATSFPPKGCQVPLKTVLVDVNGDSHPCFAITQSMGNVNDTSLSTIWHGASRKALAVAALEKKCRGCLRACGDVEGYDSGLKRVFRYVVDRGPGRWVRYLKRIGQHAELRTR